MNRHRPILYVEDDPNDVYLLRRALGEAGIPNPLVTLNDGEGAVDYLSAEDRAGRPAPGLILLDLNLPGKSGLDILRWIRSTPSLALHVVLILSSSNQERDIRAAFSAGANAYLVKPSGHDELLSLVKSIRSFWLDHNRFPESVGPRP